MNHCGIATGTILISLVTSVFDVNPFLKITDDKQVAARFYGTELGDEIDAEEIPLIARVVMRRIASMPWEAVFKIEFTGLKSNAPRRWMSAETHCAGTRTLNQNRLSES
jgi:hypothetical protein